MTPRRFQKAPGGSPGTRPLKAPGASQGTSRPYGSHTHPLSSARTAPTARPAFTLTELLVAVAIILSLMTLLGAAAAAARNGAKISSTRATIDKLNTIISQQYATYGSRPFLSATTSALRASAIRRTLTADLPDSWDDVALISSGTVRVLPPNGPEMLPNTSAQRAYAGIWNALSAAQKTKNTPAYVGDKFGDAECLFMIVMRGGIADCLDCGALRTTDIGDQDGDGMPEFLDAWGNPIRYVLWPAGLQLPANNGSAFFSADVPFLGSPTGRVMRPLIFSGGPDQTNSTAVNGDSYLNLGLACGTPNNNFGGLSGAPDGQADNITNFDAEAKQ